MTTDAALFWSENVLEPSHELPSWGLLELAVAGLDPHEPPRPASRYDCECGGEFEHGGACSVCGKAWGSVFDADAEVETLYSRGQQFGSWTACPVLPFSDPHTWTFDPIHYKLCRDRFSVLAPSAYLSSEGLVCINTHGEATAWVQSLYEGLGLVWNWTWWRWEMDLTESAQAYALKGALEMTGAGVGKNLLCRMVEVVG